MRVFVGQVVDCLPNKHWKWDKVAHLFVPPDTPLEMLHLFAKTIGLKRSWFQNRAGKMPHYDLTPGKRVEAIIKGADEATKGEEVDAFRKWKRKRRE